jgi:hypothetical protein
VTKHGLSDAASLSAGDACTRRRNPTPYFFRHKSRKPAAMNAISTQVNGSKKKYHHIRQLSRRPRHAGVGGGPEWMPESATDVPCCSRARFGERDGFTDLAIAFGRAVDACPIDPGRRRRLNCGTQLAGTVKPVAPRDGQRRIPMPTKSTPRKTSGKSERTRSAQGPDAIKLLTADHREVKAMFQEYQKLVDHEADDDEKQPIAEQICAMLTVHAQIEEELFYPAAKKAIKEPDLIDEATVEHATAKELIAQLRDSDPTDVLYDAKVKVLGEYIDHHVKEEESELFPQARRAKMDLVALGEQLDQRKMQLLEELGIIDNAEEAVQ